MNKNDLIYKRTARRIIESPRSREQMLSVLDNTPPVVPERKQGKWIKTYRNGFGTLIGYCDKCGHSNTVSNFCPNCGADMRGGQDA